MEKTGLQAVSAAFSGAGAAKGFALRSGTMVFFE
jgi:hypothetical protein